MKRSTLFLFRTIVIIQLCAAPVLGIYSFVISTAATRDEDYCARIEQEWQDTSHKAKTLEEQLSTPPANFAHDAYNTALWNEHFSTTIFMASIFLFIFSLFSLIQLLSLQKIEKPPIIDSHAPPKTHNS